MRVRICGTRRQCNLLRRASSTFCKYTFLVVSA
jgi:hypothetical protein